MKSRQWNESGMELEQLIISNIEGMEKFKERGKGCYGAVYEIRVNGVPCIAKRLHNILLGRAGGVAISGEDKEAVIAKFRQECLLLSKLKHPNILQFMGVHIGEGEGDITLIMESACIDLEKCIQTYPNMPLCLKVRILHDIACGLTYLHSFCPDPIIHCDLNQTNVLLSDTLEAKITNLGVSKYPKLSAMSTVAGRLGHIPPEAMQTSPVYNTKFDCFSFGHLSLYVLNGKSPEVVNAKVTLQDIKMKQIEIAKRRTAIDMLGPEHILGDLVQMCLSDEVSNRPSSREIGHTLEEALADYPQDIYSTLQAVQEKEACVQQLVHDNQTLKVEISYLTEKVQNNQKHIVKLKTRSLDSTVVSRAYDVVDICNSETHDNCRQHLEKSGVYMNMDVSCLSGVSDVESQKPNVYMNMDKGECISDDSISGVKPLYTGINDEYIYHEGYYTSMSICDVPQPGKQEKAYQSISAGDYQDVTFPYSKSMDLDDFHFGKISCVIAENLCMDPGEYLVRISPTTGELILTVRQTEGCIHFNIYKEEDSNAEGVFSYYIEEKTKRKRFLQLTNLIGYITNERRILITKDRDIILHPTSKREKKIVSSREVVKKRIINVNGTSSNTYFDGIFLSNSEKVVIVVHEDTKRILGEANILRRLSHPNIVQMVGLHLKDPVCLVLETDTRHSLHEYIKGSRRKKRLTKTCRDVCCGMIYLHSQNYIHRCLRSQCCFITRNNTIKIADFSKCCSIGEDGHITANSPISIPTHCAAPEVLEDAIFSKYSDVWSYGILVCEIFNRGQSPFSSLRKDQLADKIQSGFNLSLPSKYSDYDGLVELCLQFIPDTRPTFEKIRTILINETV